MQNNTNEPGLPGQQEEFSLAAFRKFAEELARQLHGLRRALGADIEGIKGELTEKIAEAEAHIEIIARELLRQSEDDQA